MFISRVAKQDYRKTLTESAAEPVLASADRPLPRRDPRWQLLVVAVLLAAGCSHTANTRSTPRSTQPPPTPTGAAATVPAYDRGRFAAVILLPGAGSMTVADGVLWVLDTAGTVVRIDPRTNAAVGKPLRVPADAAAIAVSDGALWVASVAPGDLGAVGDDTVARIDLASGRTVATVRVGRAPLDVAVMPGAVWVTNAGAGGDSVTRIDPKTDRLAGRPVRTGASPQSLTVGGGSLWVANHDAGTVSRIDLASGKVVRTSQSRRSPWSTEIRSGSSSVLVQEPAEQITPTDPTLEDDTGAIEIGRRIQCPHPALREGVRAGRLDRCQHHLSALGAEHVVEGAADLASWSRSRNSTRRPWSPSTCSRLARQVETAGM